MVELIERSVVHYALNDPRTTRGGVESFAQNLGLVFREVLFMTPKTRDLALVRERRLPVICDNQLVLDWPSDVPVIGFQHGVVLKKLFALRKRELLGLARRQARAAARKNTLWVACARWISETFARLHGNRAAHVIYELAQCRQPLLVRLVLLKIALEQHYARGPQIRQQRTVTLVQLRRRPQADQEMIARRADV